MLAFGLALFALLVAARAAHVPAHPAHRRPDRRDRARVARHVARRGADDDLLRARLVARAHVRARRDPDRRRSRSRSTSRTPRRPARSPATWQPVDLVSAEEVFLGSHVRAITLRLAQKDAYTEQHTRRVALRAVQVGERARALARPPAHARDRRPRPRHRQALGARRDPQEAGAARRRRVRRDPAPPGAGGEAARRARRLPGVGAPTRPRPPRAARRHRLPDTACAPSDLSLDTRILAVCDVYDALISSRVYRGAWTHAQAMALLRAGAGTAYDSRCVEALDAVLALEPR